ncbi:hypothetical protein [Clostridium beijerinckii]|uniref:hypothetical protein n=1 Tax=Clostridium beijerinckii TaxID=1520 RepID=UPI0014943630|nr:hypothetical protein [Clostridium beijerinckii]NOW04159.1 putative GH43/DUF377 family glycosyl hydrolase [Clostridium beijerinckii]NYC02700.1 putative GH43/DUF377 family glycosyl hydrolase [Clostridium beijerinckii]
MKWEKKGIIYSLDGSSTWAKNSTLQPTPLLLNDDTIRIFVGLRDDKGVSRVGYVDVDANNPKIVKKVSKEPLLDIGLPGTFDDNGVVPCAVIRNEGKIHLYYAGYQVGYHVRMMIYCGLAISEDNGNSFKRYSKVPVLERCDDELLFRVIHSVVKENGKWKVYYGGGSYFKEGKKKTLPLYDIRYMESEDGINFVGSGDVIIGTQGDEYRVGRPYVIKDEDIYKMFFCAGSEDLTYKLAYAESLDGINWTRDDDKLNISLSPSGWDSQMMAYPSVVKYNDKTYLFYNGNDYGYDGFGYAELIK